MAKRRLIKNNKSFITFLLFFLLMLSSCQQPKLSNKSEDTMPIVSNQVAEISNSDANQSDTTSDLEAHNNHYRIEVVDNYGKVEIEDNILAQELLEIIRVHNDPLPQSHVNLPFMHKIRILQVSNGNWEVVKEFDISWIDEVCCACYINRSAPGSPYLVFKIPTELALKIENYSWIIIIL